MYVDHAAIRRVGFWELVAMINAFTHAWNEGSGPFTWVKTADEIFAKALRKPRQGSPQTASDQRIGTLGFVVLVARSRSRKRGGPAGWSVHDVASGKE